MRHEPFISEVSRKCCIVRLQRKKNAAIFSLQDSEVCDKLTARGADEHIATLPEVHYA